SPRLSAVRAVPTRGEVRLRSTSTPRAFSGEMYRTLVLRRPRPAPPPRSPPRPGPAAARPGPDGRSAGAGPEARRAIAVRKAARVLPEPVGATTSVSSPRSMASHAAACAGVGASNDSSNHRAVAGEKEDGSAWRVMAIAPLWTGPPTARRAEPS